MTPAEMAIENVEAVLLGEITEPSVGTLAHRVLEFSKCENMSARAWMSTATEMANGLEFYRGIVWKIGDMFGVAARTSDDGSIQDSVLALKVPELVEAALRGPTVTVKYTDMGGQVPISPRTYEAMDVAPL